MCHYPHFTDKQTEPQSSYWLEITLPVGGRNESWSPDSQPLALTTRLLLPQQRHKARVVVVVRLNDPPTSSNPLLFLVCLVEAIPEFHL